MSSSQKLPAIDELFADGRLRLQPPDRVTLEGVMQAARDDLAAAAANVDNFPAWAETMLYEAGLRCARVIVQSAGYRIGADRGHVTAIDAADELSGRRHHRRFVRLHRMRRQRHEFMYETGPEPTLGDLEQARSDVEALIDLADAALQEIS